MVDFAGDRSLKQWYNTIAEIGWRLEEFQHYYGNSTFDDDVTTDATRFLLRMYLEREEYLIDEAEDGEEALLKATEDDYDLILLDLMMPGLDGIEVCRQLREKKATPIIMLTAKGEETNRVQGF